MRALGSSLRSRRTPALALGALVALAMAVAGCGGVSYGSGSKPASTSSAPAASSGAPATTSKPASPAPVAGIPQNNGGDHDGDNNGGPSDGDGNI